GAFDINETFRIAHSLKGTAGTYGFKVISDITAHLENLLSSIRDEKTKLTKQIILFIIKSFEVTVDAFQKIKKRYAVEKIISSEKLDIIEEYTSLLSKNKEIQIAFPFYLKADHKKTVTEVLEKAVNLKAVIAFNANFTKSIVKSALKEKGYEVFETKCGIEALNLLYEKKCGLLVTFNNLERMNGPAICAAVKLSRGDLGPVKVIVVTSNRSMVFTDNETAPDKLILVDDALDKNIKAAC
ncbi:MAG TPA: Hpt domain-containing protein, partial [Candidatus Wallbacteria bacterium]|nr:Hpt domain-containing protein [Candidatus Wallbacteria bacterium]